MFLHETSYSAMQRIFKKTHRLLAPGGIVLHVEQPQYSPTMPLFEQAMRDWGAFYNAEPFWTKMHEADLDAWMVQAGFARESLIHGGLPTIHPMQVKGPDGEIVYLTQINSDLPAFDLLRAASLIDRLFILVLACSDLEASIAWFERVTGLRLGERMDIPYTMLANAFDLPLEQRHRIATLVHARDIFLELDQYPPAATPRAQHDGQLPPGIAICTLSHPDLSAVKGDCITPPARRDGPIYGGRLSGTLRAPDGSLLELVQLPA